MTNFGGGDFQQQARQAAEHGTGGPAQRPGNGDKRAVLLLLAGLAAVGVALFLIAEL
jgi:hypothetical protein